MDNTNNRRQLTPEERAERRARAKKRRRIQNAITGGALLLAVIFLISTVFMAAKVKSLSSQSSSGGSRGIYEAAALARHTDPAPSKVSKAGVVTNVEASFFDDAVFVGDSVSLKLQQYVEDQREAGQSCLGNAQFFTEGGLGYGNQLLAIENVNGLHAKYNGSPTYVEDAVEAMGVSKVYIMLGMNDIGLYGVDTTVENAGAICDKIMEKNPSVQIFIQSVTPMLKASEGSKLNNTSINEFNEKMMAFCQERGYYYLDIASVVKDADGYLKLEYCGDANGMGMHFTNAGCEAWVSYLMENPYGVSLEG